jgi:2-C-methyl-D-erythritol 4-phosphate cytidylyltransferase
MPAGTESTAQHVVGLLVAGGRGSRFGSDEPKQFALLGGRPLMTYAAAVFDETPALDGWIAVAPAGMETRTRQVLEAAGVARRLREVVPGGATRQQSVWNGLQAVGEGAVCVVVHDAARPFVTAALVQRAAAAAAQVGAATVALPVSDTLFRVATSDVLSGDAGGEAAVVVSGTRVDRDRLWSVQTPQAFRVEVLRAAHERAGAAGADVGATDDGGLVLENGGRIALIAGVWWNLKVTTAEDLVRAELYVDQRVRLGWSD